jgi:hypothetical protein
VCMRAASPVLMVRTARELACHHRGRQHLQVRRLDEVQLPLQLRPQHRIATVARGSQPPAKLAHGELLGLLQRLPPARNARSSVRPQGDTNGARGARAGASAHPLDELERVMDALGAQLRVLAGRNSHRPGAPTEKLR